ncbi:TetR/AcrR family transcriptional regulator [Desulfothermus okinawensis JCM 13304]
MHEKKEQIHDTALEILKAAQELFYEKGYEKATTREISQRVGISKAALYHHFTNKEEILFKICIRAADELINNMRQAISRNRTTDAPLKEKIKDIMLEYTKTYLKNKNFNKILLHEIEFLSPEKKRKILDKETENVHQLRDFLKELMDAGVIKKFDPTVMTFSIISALHWLYFWFKPEKKLSLEEVIEQIASMYLDGIEEKNRT